MKGGIKEFLFKNLIKQKLDTLKSKFKNPTL